MTTNIPFASLKVVSKHLLVCVLEGSEYRIARQVGG